MRPLEIVLVVGAVLMVLAWATRRRLPAFVPLALAAVAIVHLLLEGHRVVMWPLYLGIAISVLGVAFRDQRPGPPRRFGWRSVVRGLVAVLLLLFVLLPALWPVMRLPAPTGPYRVGTSWLVVTDSSRAERFGPAGAVREVPVKVWYPADSASGPPAPYADPREMTGGMMPVLLFGQARYIKTHSYSNVPVAAGEERFPVLIFSHGFGAYAAQNTPQMEELASQGYVVFSIAHPGEASWAPFPDGRGVPFDSGLQKQLASMVGDKSAIAKIEALMARIADAKTPETRRESLRAFLEFSPEPLRSESVAEWAADTRALVDRLEVINAGSVGSPLRGRLDLDRLGVFGMSYGGATAGEFCSVDPRCKAAVNMDGGQYGRLIDGSIAVPFLILAAEPNHSIHVPVLDLATGPTYLATVPATTHIGLTDMTLMAPILFRYAGVTGRLSPDRREAIMTAYLLGFFDQYLRGKPSPLLAEGSDAFPEVTLIRRNVP